jgi:predicted GNAT family acetyltransferase
LTDAIQRILREDGQKGGYFLREGTSTAFLTYSVTSPTLIIADHTEVPEAMRGTGAGRKLLDRMIADARADGFKIVPLCPFVHAQRQKHPEWADVFTS